MELTRQTILIVDDNPMNLKLAEFALKKDYDILLAKSGEDALKLLESTPVDLILLDILMPGMNGFEVYDELRKMDSCKVTPVAFLTADTEEESLNTMAKLQVPYIEKPFVPVTLINTVKSLLQ